MINELAEIWNEIIEMQKAYPVAFGAWTMFYIALWSIAWGFGEFTIQKISLKRSSERHNKKNGKTGKKE